MPRQRPPQLDASWVPTLIKYMSRAQTWVYQRTGGRIGGNWRIGAGFRKPVPTLLLEHRGRKSGKVFTIPLVYITDGSDIVIVASNGGQRDHPQWYRNLVASPDTHIQLRTERVLVRAHTADTRERARLWPQLVQAYADFDSYQAWTDREIPVVVLQRTTP